MVEPTYILRGVAGSNAHGLATPESDVDVHGIFSWPTDLFWGLWKPPESIVKTSPDSSAHEIEKFCKLAAAANPSSLEDLWLPEYTDMEPGWGNHLLEIRDSFLSAKRVFNAYRGYAYEQWKKIQKDENAYDEDGSPSLKTSKSTKHIVRLMEQGKRLYETGELKINVDNRDFYFSIMKLPKHEAHEIFNAIFINWVQGPSPLPENPDYVKINEYIYSYRMEH